MKWCDGKKDCTSGLDEAHCDCTKNPNDCILEREMVYRNKVEPGNSIPWRPTVQWWQLAGIVIVVIALSGAVCKCIWVISGRVFGRNRNKDDAAVEGQGDPPGRHGNVAGEGEDVALNVLTSTGDGGGGGFNTQNQYWNAGENEPGAFSYGVGYGDPDKITEH